MSLKNERSKVSKIGASRPGVKNNLSVHASGFVLRHAVEEAG